MPHEAVASILLTVSLKSVLAENLSVPPALPPLIPAALPNSLILSTRSAAPQLDSA